MSICGDSSALKIIGFLLILFSFLLQLIGVVTPYWIYKTVEDVEYYSGLWQHCGTNILSTTCSELRCDVTLEGLDFPGCKFAWGAVQAFEMFGLIGLLCSFIFGILKLCLWRDKSILIMICINGCFLAGGAILIGITIYVTQNFVNVTDLHFSFGVCVLAAAGSIVGGILMFCGK